MLLNEIQNVLIASLVTHMFTLHRVGHLAEAKDYILYKALEILETQKSIGRDEASRGYY